MNNCAAVRAVAATIRHFQTPNEMSEFEMNDRNRDLQELKHQGMIRLEDDENFDEVNDADEDSEEIPLQAQGAGSEENPAQLHEEQITNLLEKIPAADSEQSFSARFLRIVLWVRLMIVLVNTMLIISYSANSQFECDTSQDWDVSREEDSRVSSSCSYSNVCSMIQLLKGVSPLSCVPTFLVLFLWRLASVFTEWYRRDQDHYLHRNRPLAEDEFEPEGDHQDYSRLRFDEIPTLEERKDRYRRRIAGVIYYQLVVLCNVALVTFFFEANLLTPLQYRPYWLRSIGAVIFNQGPQCKYDGPTMHYLWFSSWVFLISTLGLLFLGVPFRIRSMRVQFYIVYCLLQMQWNYLSASKSLAEEGSGPSSIVVFMVSTNTSQIDNCCNAILVAIPATVD